MIIKLDGYSDLGKCSFGTLLDDYDTELHDIYLNGKYIEIKKVEDLFPFLWQHAGISVRNGDKEVSHFSEEGTWWRHIYEGGIKKSDKKIQYYMRKLRKEKDLRKQENIITKIKSELAHINFIFNFITVNDERMEEIKQKLIEANNGIRTELGNS